MTFILLFTILKSKKMKSIVKGTIGGVVLSGLVLAAYKFITGKKRKEDDEPKSDREVILDGLQELRGMKIHDCTKFGANKGFAAEATRAQEIIWDIESRLEYPQVNEEQTEEEAQ